MLYDFDDKKALSRVRNLLYVVLILASLFTGVVFTCCQIFYISVWKVTGYFLEKTAAEYVQGNGQPAV